MLKSGGRGFVLGDQGSAFRFGRDALLEFLNNPTGATETLSEAVQELFESQDENVIVSRLYRSASPAAMLARLAKPLAIDAQSGREYATSSVRRNVAELADVILHHLERNMPGRKAVTISLAGGLWSTSPIFRETLMQQLSERLPNVAFDLNKITRPPVHGAAMLAKEVALVD
jgi:N-acetylglucosamine kinase-like BadF-type ATPase